MDQGWHLVRVLPDYGWAKRQVQYGARNTPYSSHSSGNPTRHTQFRPPQMPLLELRGSQQLRGVAPALQKPTKYPEPHTNHRAQARAVQPAL